MANQLAVALTKVKKQFEKGHVAKAGKLLGEERQRASWTGDTEALATVDEWATQLRTLVQGEQLREFDTAMSEATRVIDVSPVGLVFAGCGALAMLISVFLPYAESNSVFTQIEQNTLIQNGVGWLFVILVIVDAVSTYRAYRLRTRTWGPILTGAIGISAAIYFGSNGGNSLQLCSVATGTNCETANPGIGVYVAGVGAVLMLVGGLMIRASKGATVVESATPLPSAPVSDQADARPTKDCPECAETILAAARVCKHCGYRFPDDATAPSATA